MSPRWYNRAGRRMADRRVVALVLIGLALIVGYQAWALRQTNRNAETAETVKTAVAKVKKLTKVQCASAASFYTLIVQLAEDTGPHFGTPVGVPTIPGRRAATIAKLNSQVTTATAALRSQGCRIPKT